MFAPLFCIFPFFFFFFNDTATTEIYTLSLHDALPIWSPLFATAIEQWLFAVLRPVCSIARPIPPYPRSEEHTSELQSHSDLVCRLLLEKKKNKITQQHRNVRSTDVSITPVPASCHHGH